MVAGSVRVRAVASPSQVPVTRKVPHVVPRADSSPSTCAQSHPTRSGPPHWGGYESSWTWHICGPCSGLSSTIVSAW